MQLTSFTDYGLRALLFMAMLPEQQMTSITEVTRAYGLSRNHMVKIINHLSRSGYVAAVRGKNGGIRLGKPPEKIIIGHVVREMEPLQLINCDKCHIMSACKLKKMLNNAALCFLQELDKYTLADLIKNNHPLHTLLLADRSVITPK